MRRFEIGMVLLFFATAVLLARCAPPPPGTAAPTVTALTPATHRSFPIATGWHAVDCNSCHGSSDTFKGFDCLGCHTDARTTPRHAQVSGFSFDSPSCYGCHATGTGGAIDPAIHAGFFPTAAGTKHAGMACSSCHVTPADRTRIDCTGCHQQAIVTPKHVDVGGFTWLSSGELTTSLCLGCHAESQVARVAAHLPFQITSGFAHYQTGCLDCHSTNRVDKPYAADFTQKDCLPCHSATQTTHAGRPGFSFDTPSCLGCHPAGTRR
jgi:hypothetical protein